MGVGSDTDHGIRRVHSTKRDSLHGISQTGRRELGRHLQRCLKHEDVARQLTLRDLNLACEQWVCESLRELTEEMEMWKWDSTLGNKWARVAKCSQHSARNGRGHQNGAERYELCEGNT